MTAVHVPRTGPAPERAPELADPVRVGPFVAGARPFVVHTDNTGFAAHLADCLRDLRSDSVESETVVLLVVRHGGCGATASPARRR